MFLIYVTWLATTVPGLLPFVLTIITLVIIVLDMTTLVLAAAILRQRRYLRLLPFIPLFAPFQFVIMRNARLFAYVEELIFSTSRHDEFVPLKVRKWSTWH